MFRQIAKGLEKKIINLQGFHIIAILFRGRKKLSTEKENE